MRLFSRWGELVDAQAEKLLAPTGWSAPDPDRYPTGAEWAQRYLQPLADVLGDRVRFGARVVGVARRGRDLVVDAGPGPGAVGRARGHRGRVRSVITARAVLDASGTWTRPNPLGGDGLPALGERAAADRIVYRVPDLTDPAVRARYAGKRIAVAGSGHSALTALVAFAELAETAPGTHVDWLLRRGQVGDTFGGGDADQLPARGALGEQARRAVAAGHIDTVTGFRTAAVTRSADGRLVLYGVDGRRADAGRRGGGADRVPSRPVVPVRGAAGPGRGVAGPACAGAADRPERALVRHRLPARRAGAGPARAGGVPGRDEELRARPDVPGAHRLRAGPLGGGRAGRGPGGGRAGRAGPAGDRGVRR